jgi:hypothetical protein
MKHEYHEGPEALDKFNKNVTRLFSRIEVYRQTDCKASV